MANSFKRMITLFCVMFRIGAFTFGGGWSIISQVQEEFVEKRGWMTEEQIMDYMSLARTFPGIMVVNFSILSGYAMGSFAGAAFAAFGLVAPAILVISLVALFYDSIKNSLIVAKTLNGIRSAVIPIILSAAYKMKSKALTTRSHWLLALAAFSVCTFTQLSKSFIVIGGAAVGFFIQRKAVNHDAAS